jgi:hypothetical protein
LETRGCENTKDIKFENEEEFWVPIKKYDDEE